MHKVTLWSAVTLLLGAGSAAAGPGSAFIQQVAAPASFHAGNTFPETSSVMDIRHAEGVLLEGLRSRFGAMGGAEIDQAGDSHTASIFQEQGAGNISVIEQRGVGNFVSLIQSGSTNTLTLSQWGSGNSTHGTQSGDGNYARISQRNERNIVRFYQSGTGNMLTVVQD